MTPVFLQPVVLQAMLDPTFEDMATGERMAIHCVRKSCGDLATDHDWHFHPQFELTWFITSAGTRYVGDCVERYAPGDIVLSGPYLPHCWRNDLSGSSGERPEWIVVQFSLAALGEGLLDLPEAASVGRLLDAARCGLAFDSDAVRLVGPLLQALNTARGLMRLLRLMEVLHILAGVRHRRLAMDDYHVRNIVDQSLVERLDRVMRYVAEHFRGTVSQADLADELAMSPAALSKFVRATTGATFTGLVKRARINEACRLLALSGERITDIALDCGYAHTSHFDHHFLELKGVTPGEYRRRMMLLRDAAGKNRTSGPETAV